MSELSNSPPHLSGLTSLFKKDITQERSLAKMNAAAAIVQRTLEEGLDAPARPPVFVLGLPRSGTTLTMQLLASTGLFCTATNFVSRFWDAPAFGLLAQKALGLDQETYQSNYQSKRGGTEGWLEPSEFGYFWSKFFDLGQTTHALGPDERDKFDAAGLKRALASMERQGSHPLAFKNNTWFTLNADFIAQLFPGCVLVACERDPYFVAQSIWLQRRDLYGDPARWWSMRPQTYEQISKLSPLEQVAAQAIDLKEGMRQSLAQAIGAKIEYAPYHQLCSAPRQIAHNILIAAGFGSATADAACARLPESLRNTDQDRLVKDQGDELRSLIDTRLEGKAPQS